MTGYTKLFGRILDSTIWQEDNPTRILWITMLAMADRDGLVMASVPGLASRAKISLSECEAGLAKFQEPDPYSQSPVDEGRRIQVVTGGWLLINYEMYRQKMNAEEQRERARLRQQRSRMSRKSVTDCDRSHDVTHVTQCHDIAEAKAEAKAEADTKGIKAKASGTFVPPTLKEVTVYCMERNSEVEPEKFHDYYTSQGWYVGKNRMKDWRAAVRNWERNNKGGPFRGGYQASSNGISKHQQRVINNREAILAGLGISPMPGQCEPSVQHGHAPGTSPDMAGRLLKGKA